MSSRMSGRTATHDNILLEGDKVGLAHQEHLGQTQALTRWTLSMQGGRACRPLTPRSRLTDQAGGVKLGHTDEMIYLYNS